MQRGRVPHKRHTQFRRDDGTLYAEELFGVEGFAGRSSLLYHHTPPTQTHQIDDPTPVKLESADPAAARRIGITWSTPRPWARPVTRCPGAFRSSSTPT